MLSQKIGKNNIYQVKLLSQKIGKNNIYQVCSAKRLERITFIKIAQSKDWKE